MIRNRGVLLFFLATLLAGICAAQTTTSDIVYVLAKVTGPKKSPAPGLKQNNFQVLEDGVEQKITFFAPPDGAWEINMLVAAQMLLPGRADRISSSIRDSVDAFKKASNPRDRINVEELSFGSDGLFAAIDRNLEDLQKTTNPRKALIVITDGFDKQYTTGGNSGITDLSSHAGGDPANALVEFSRKLNIPIYFLYIRTLSADPAAAQVGARGIAYSAPEGEVLTNVAEQTGGGIYFVDAEHQLEAECKFLSEELRNKYVLGFRSTNDKKNNKWRNLKVLLNVPAGIKLNLSVKKKYFVPKPQK